jgi:hypothetical protein
MDMTTWRSSVHRPGRPTVGAEGDYGPIVTLSEVMDAVDFAIDALPDSYRVCAQYQSG